MFVVAEAQKPEVTAEAAPAPKVEVKPVADNGLGLGNFINDIAPKAEEAQPAAIKADEKPQVVEAKAKVEDAKPAAKAADTKPEETTEKRLKDTQKWGNEEHKARLKAEQTAADLKAAVARLEAKIDGTYKEPDAPSTEVQVNDAEKRGLIVASHHAAVELHGEEFVQATVWADDSPYQELIKQDPSIQERVMASKAPVLAAIKEVKKAEASLKYGKDPEEIRKKIIEEETEKITKEVLAKFATPPGTPVKGLGEVRGTERTEMKSGPPAEVDFKRIFHIGGYAS